MAPASTPAPPVPAAEVVGIKHMAFAVSDAEGARATYARLLGIAPDGPIHDYAGSRTRVALFRLGGIEYQLCQSMDADGRFAAWIAERGEGLHHICYEVADIEAALAHAQRNGSGLKTCRACGVAGSHPHPEGFVAFLAADAGGVEIEFMQVYTDEERRRYEAVKDV